MTYNPYPASPPSTVFPPIFDTAKDEPVGFPFLYIIMRTDLASMNPGKAIAQGSHASNYAAGKAAQENPIMYKAWANQAKGQFFGTVLVLQAKDLDAINNLVEEALKISIVANTSLDTGVMGIVHDSTYPIRDGQTTHYIPLDTCGFIMCYKGSKINDLVVSRKADFPLHR